METTLPLPFIPSVDLDIGPSSESAGLSRVQLSYLGCVYLTANSANLDKLFQFLQRHISIETYANVSSVDSVEDIVSILDAGARKVFVKPSQVNSLKTYGDRVLPIYSATENVDYSNGVLFSPTSSSEVKSILEKLKAEKVSPVFLQPTEDELKSNLEKYEYSFIPVIPTVNLTTEQASSGLFSVPELIASSWTSDRSDKLMPTVVTDERGIALGLVYSSKDSLAESLKTGTGVYQSRKRGLWYKGATSGDTQELVRLSLDCDQDCLKFVVKQKGQGKYHRSQLSPFTDFS